MTEFALAVFAAAFALSVLETPLAAWLARAVNLVAAVRPDRLHREPRPYGGGIAIADAVLVVVLLGWLMAAGYLPLPPAIPEGVTETLDAGGPVLVRLGIGAVLFFVLGLIDDRMPLPAILKLLAEAWAAGVVVILLGFKATVWLDVPYAAEAVSILWILAVVNAYNMFDHADGLAAVVGMVAMLALAAGQMLMGEVLVPCVALATAGALAGFLVHNFPPARVFMGDAGSHLVGYLLAALTMLARYYFPERGTSRLVVLVPLAILAVPLFDMGRVTLARLACGHSPLRGDATSHLGHRLLARGCRPRRAVLIVAYWSIITGGASVGMYYMTGTMMVVPWLIVAIALARLALLAWFPREAEGTP